MTSIELPLNVHPQVRVVNGKNEADNNESAPKKQIK